MTDRRIEVLKMISADMESDAKNLDGLPFNGTTVGMQFGHQGAAITTLAEIIQTILEERSHKEEANDS